MMIKRGEPKLQSWFGDNGQYLEDKNMQLRSDRRHKTEVEKMQ